MAVTLNFRSALGGFNREDVVHYIEYMNSKHTGQVNQLEGEAEELRRKLEQLQAVPDLSQELNELKAQLEAAQELEAALTQEREQLKAELATARDEIETMKASQAEAAAVKVAAMELEAYRRAEQAERKAKARAEQIYQQAVGTLAEATSQVDTAANRFRQVAEQVNAQLSQLQTAVDGSKNALLDAATTMYSIHPEETFI